MKFQPDRVPEASALSASLVESLRSRNSTSSQADQDFARPTGSSATRKPLRLWPPTTLRCPGEDSVIHWLGLHLVFAAVLGLLLTSSPASAGVREIGPIVLTVGDLDRQLAFYTNALPFVPLAEECAQGPELERMTGLPAARTRSVTLGLGDERIQLVQFLEPKGRPLPADSRSFDHWFQHLAIVVSDMDRAYAHLRAHQVRHVSTAPQTLPAWNPDAGGIRAFYFRDPEDHVLEVIWFPPGKGDSRWQRGTTNLFLGIDHTAIVVGDTERSLAFYREELGLRMAGGSENWGTEQEHLNQVFGARLRITALRAERGPGIEFLEYLTPPGGRPLTTDAQVNDLLAWRVRVRVDEPKPSTAGPIPPEATNGTLIRDPDGHLLELHTEQPR